MLRAIDNGLLRLLRTRGHDPQVERWVLAYTHAGEHGVMWHSIALVGVLLGGRRNRPAFWRSMRAIGAAYAANTAVKYVFRRARPVLEAELPHLAPTITGHSYPSAHSSMSFAAASTLSEVLPAPPLYLMASAMALSRPYVGVHYPTDVLAGAVLGVAVGRLLR